MILTGKSDDFGMRSRWNVSATEYDCAIPIVDMAKASSRAQPSWRSAIELIPKVTYLTSATHQYETSDIAAELTRLVNLNISSISTMSEMLELQEDFVRETLESLINDHKLEGRITDDGERFFRSDLIRDGSTIVSSEGDGSRSLKLRIAKMCLIATPVLFILGQILIRMGPVGSVFESAAVACIMSSIFSAGFALVGASDF